MSAKCVNNLMLAVAAALSLASERDRVSTASEVGQLENQDEETPDPLPTQIDQQAMALIQQRAVVLQLTLPPLAFRGNPHSRFFEANFPRHNASALENPEWRSHLTAADDGAVELDLPTAFRLAVLHSDAYQRQVESLFLAAYQALLTHRGTADGRVGPNCATMARDLLDAEIKRVCSCRQQLLATVAAGNTRGSLSSGTVHPPSEFGTTLLAGYLGLVERQHWIQLTKDLLAAHSRELARLEIYHENGLLALSNVEVYRQRVEQQRAELDSAESSFHDALDSFKIKILGLPSSLPVRVKPALSSRFELIGPLAKQLAERITKVREEFDEVRSESDVKVIQRLQRELSDLLNQAESLVSEMEKDLQQFEQLPVARARNMTDADSEKLLKAKLNLRDELRELRREMTNLGNSLSQMRGLSTLISRAAVLHRAVRRCAIVQARIRLEGPCLAPVELELRNACRLIQQADRELRQKQKQMLAAWQEVRLSEDAETHPAARAARIVQYQRTRRKVMLGQDAIEADVRSTFDTLARLETSLEIQRRAVAIAQPASYVVAGKPDHTPTVSSRRAPTCVW